MIINNNNITYVGVYSKNRYTLRICIYIYIYICMSAYKTSCVTVIGRDSKSVLYIVFDNKVCTNVYIMMYIILYLSYCLFIDV